MRALASLYGLLAGARAPASLLLATARAMAASRARSLALRERESAADRAESNRRVDRAIPGPSAPKKAARVAPPPPLPTHVLGALGFPGCSYWPRWAKDVDRAELELFELIERAAGLSSDLSFLETGRGDGAFGRWWRTRHGEGTIQVAGAAGAESDPGSRSSGPPDGSHQRFDRILAFEPVFAWTGAGSNGPNGSDSESSPLARAIQALLGRLTPGGRLYVQFPAHWRDAYAVEAHDRWMLPWTPAGALLPGGDLVAALDAELEPLYRRELSGEHYERTARAWRSRLSGPEGTDRGSRGSARIRAALLAIEAAFGYREGQEWWLVQRVYEAR